TYNGHKDFVWNGKTYNSCTVAHGLFYANAGADLTVVDTSEEQTGTVMVYGLASGAYVASNDTTFTIEGGTWKNEVCETCGGTNIFLYPLQGGELYIKGGYFEQALDSNGESYLIVEHGGEYKNSVIDYSKTKVEITGGTFVGMNPEEIKYFQQTADDKLVMGETTDGCADGFAAADNGDDSYTVKPLITVEFDNVTMVNGNELPKFTYTTNFTEVAEDGMMLVVGKPEVTVNGVGEYEINAEAYVFMSNDYVVRVTPGKLTVVEAVAKIGEVYYASIEEAIEAANAGDQIDLLADVVTVSGLTIEAEKDIIIDLNGKTLNLKPDSIGFNASVAMDLKGKLTVQGEGAVTVERHSYTYTYGIRVLATGTLILNGGNYTVNGSTGALALTRGEVQINGGSFKSNSGESYELIRHTYLDTAKVTITGGVFERKAISTGAETPDKVEISGGYFVEKVREDWCAEGYVPVKKVIEGKTWYTVAKGEYVAQIGEDKYVSIQDAIDVAVDGDTVVVLKDVEYDWDDTVTASDGKPVLFNVEGKSITLDLNGKKISLTHLATEEADRIYAVVLVADGASLTVTGNGTIDVTANETMPRVAYLFWKRGTTGTLTIKNGTYHMNHSEDSMVYTNGREIVTVEGGTWTLDSIGTDENGSPWIFNAQGQNDRNIIVTGGIYNADIAHQYYPFEVMMPKEKALEHDSDNGTWTVVDAVAYVNEQEKSGKWYTNEVGYATLAEAVASAEKYVENATKAGEISTVTLLTDSANDISVSKTIGFEQNGYSYTGTVTLTEKAATLTAAEGMNVITDLEGCKVVYEEGVYKVVAIKVILNGIEAAYQGEIQLRLFVTLPEEFLSDKNAYVRIVKNGKGDPAEKMITSAELLAQGATVNGYMMTQGIASGEMTCGVDYEFVSSDGYVYPLTNSAGKDMGMKATYSILDYAKLVMQYGNERQKKMVTALVTYGGYSQNYFNVDAENPAYNMLATYGVKVPDLSAVTADDIAQKNVIEGSAIGLNVYGTQTFLDSATYLRVYYKLDAGQSIDNFEFKLVAPTYDGTTNTLELIPVADAGLYYVDIKDIPAAYLDHVYKIVVTSKETNETYILNTSVLAWIKNVLIYSNNTKQINMAKAMYLYNQAANEFFGK
ncbi:MAG: hypothetical protein J6K55_12855, partial [Clostridia bacterium]|nr:hypothetical protein [Clostridia bacterium]